MYELNLPKYHFNIQEKNGKPFIFDDFRKRFVALTPEEWVRQNILKFLSSEKQYPPGLIAVEKGLKVNQMNKRTDIVIYNKQAQPIMIVECKAPEVKISQKTFEQIARYNMALKVDYLLVSNGIQHFCCKIDHQNKSFKFLKDIPDFNSL